MSDEISEAAEPEEVTEEEANVPEQAAESPAETEPQQEKAPSLEEYRQIAREEAIRAAQSQVAKGENRIQRFIQEKFQALEASKGVLNLSDEQVKQAKKDIVAQAYESAPEAEAETAAAPTPDAMIQQQAEFVYSQIDAVFNEHGVTITPNDPNFKELEKALNDPQGSFAKTLVVANKIAAAAAARTAQKKESAAGRVTGGGPVTSNDNSISGITDSATLYEIGDKQIREKRR
jgi:hypothetical protein